MKKILLALGAVVSVVAPIVVVVSCGTTKESRTVNFDNQLLKKINEAVDFGAKSGTYVDDLINERGEITGLIDLNFIPTKQVTLGGIDFKANELLNMIYYLTPDETGTVQEKLSVNGSIMNETEAPIKKIIDSLTERIVSPHKS